MSLVFENQALSSTEKLIMLALADHANDEGKSVYPSQITISRKTGLARGTVNRHIQNLIDNEYLWDKGYRLDRSNVLELEINVKRLVENVGVTESDTLDMGEGVTEDDRGGSRRVTGGVTEDDTNHHLNVINNHHLSVGVDDTAEDLELLHYFMEITLLEKPKSTHEEMFWVREAGKWINMGATKPDIVAAVKEADKRNTTLAKPSGITSYLKSAIARRKRGVSEDKNTDKQQDATDLIMEMVAKGEI
jgi:hypothetical protein